jgi:hypothetical protein
VGGITRLKTNSKLSSKNIKNRDAATLRIAKVGRELSVNAPWACFYALHVLQIIKFTSL